MASIFVMCSQFGHAADDNYYRIVDHLNLTSIQKPCRTHWPCTTHPYILACSKMETLIDFVFYDVFT